MGQSQSVSACGNKLRAAAAKGDTRAVAKLVKSLRKTAQARSATHGGSDTWLADVVNARNSNGSTPLMEAIRFGRLSAAKVLLQCPGLRIDEKDKRGWTALIVAVRTGKVQSVKLLLERGADVNHDDLQMRTPIMHAVACGYVHIIKLLLRHDADAESPDLSGWTPLMIACEQQGHLDVVNLLVEEACDVNAVSRTSAWTALMRAALRGRRAVVHKLVAEGAKLEMKNSAGWTALQLAAWNGHWAVAQDLIKEGASDAHLKLGERKEAEPRKPSKASRQPRPPLLTQAAALGQWGCVKTLIESGADVESVAKGNNTSLSLAARFGHLSLVRYLVVEARANVEHANSEGLTPIMLAARAGQRSVVHFLNSAGADTNRAVPASQLGTDRARQRDSMARLRSWQAQERQNKLEALKEAERAEAKRRKKFRIKLYKRGLADYVDPDRTSTDLMVARARLPLRKAVVFDESAGAAGQALVPCHRKCGACCCRLMCCRAVCERLYLCCRKGDVLVYERREKYRIPGKQSITAADLAHMYGHAAVAMYLEKNGGMTHRQLTEAKEAEEGKPRLPPLTGKCRSCLGMVCRPCSCCSKGGRKKKQVKAKQAEHESEEVKGAGKGEAGEALEIVSDAASQGGLEDGEQSTFQDGYDQHADHHGYEHGYHEAGHEHHEGYEHHDGDAAWQEEGAQAWQQ